jgi:hypothetical protein
MYGRTICSEMPEGAQDKSYGFCALHGLNGTQRCLQSCWISQPNIPHSPEPRPYSDLVFRFIVAYALIHVPGTVSAKDLRCRLQEMPPGRPDRCRRISIPVDCRRVPAVRGEAPLSAVLGIPRTGRSACESPEARGCCLMFDPDAHLPRINRWMIYLGACLIAGIRLARERQVNVRVVPTRQAISSTSAEIAISESSLRAVAHHHGGQSRNSEYGQIISSESSC